MSRIDTEEWIDSHDAARILTANSGHTVSDHYVRRLARSGAIRKRLLHDRLALYNRRDAEGYTVRAIHKKKALAEVLSEPWRFDILASGLTEKIARKLEVDDQQKEALDVLVREELEAALRAMKDGSS